LDVEERSPLRAADDRGVTAGLGQICRKHGLVAAKALAQREFHVAFEPRPSEMILASTLARSEHGRPRLCCKTLAAGTGGEPQ
jgi:hypothetical protein